MFENRQQAYEWAELLDTIREEAGNAPCEQFPDAFHPSRGEPDLARMAKALCRDCPVIALCASYGIKWENDGIYGGMTPYERAVIRNSKANAGEEIPRGMRVRKTPLEPFPR